MIRASCRCSSFVALRDGVLCCGACGGLVVADHSRAAVFSQVDGERPPGVGRARFLRAWRRGRAAGDVECFADGRARVMSAGAWARYGAAPLAPAAPTAPDTSILDLLGATAR